MIALKTKKLDANARLCHVVQKHRLIYDRSHVNYNSRQAFDAAWLDVSKYCEESVSACKSRWRQIRRNFETSLKEAPNKLKGSHANTYYLHDVLDFLLPHMHIDKKVQPIDDEMGIGKRRMRPKPVSDIKSKEKGDVKSEPDSDVELIETSNGNIKTQGGREVNEVNEERNCKSAGLKNEDKAEKETKPPGRPSTSTSKGEKNEKEEKSSESAKTKGDKLQESQIKKLDQSVITKPQENTKMVTPTKTPETLKKNLGAFYISPKNDGTFFIKKKNDETKAAEVEPKERYFADAELADKKDPPEKAKKDNTKDDNEDYDDDIPLKQISERSLRLQRACKRNLRKSTTDEVAEIEKEPEIKRSRRCAERLKSMVKTKQELSKSLDVPKQETKAVKMKEAEETKRKRQTLNALQTADGVDVGAQLAIKPAANSTPKIGLPPKMQTPLSPLIQTAFVVQPTTIKTLMLGKSTQTDTVTLEPRKVETGVKGVQCDLWKAETTDDFFSTLRPYLNDMNARQKLHFKKKIFESLMEVFDSDTDFPASKKRKLSAAAGEVAPTTPLIPAQLKNAVSGEELSLVRELVAMVQAAKQTPELIVNSNNKNNDSPENEAEEQKRRTLSPAVTATTSKPPPLLRVTPTNNSFQATYVSSADLPSSLQPRVSTVQQISNSLQPSTTTSPTSIESFIPASSLQKRRVIRKLVKVDDLGVGEGERRRRVYRLLPSNGTTSSTFRNAVSSIEMNGGSADIETMPPISTNLTLTSSTDMTSGGAGLVQRIKPSNITNTSNGPGGIQLISPSGTYTTSGGSATVQRIQSSDINNTSSSSGIQLISPSGTYTTSGGSRTVQRIQSSDINNTSSSSGIQLISPRSIDTTSGGAGLTPIYKATLLDGLSSDIGRPQHFKSNIIKNKLLGPGRVQVISPDEINNNLSQSTIPSLNTTPTASGSNVGPETSTAPTSSNNDAQATEVPTKTTTPKILNIRRAITILSSSSPSSTTTTSTTTKTSTLREVETPVSTIGWSFPVATVTGPTGARPPARRYSVCGPLPTSIAALGRTTNPNETSTNTHNDKLVANLSKEITVSRNSPASQQNNQQIFKLPTPLRSTNGTNTAATATAPKKLMTTRDKPSASNNNTAARTMPVLVGFNKSDPPTSTSNSNGTNELPKALNLRSYRSPNSLLNGADKRLGAELDISSADFEGIDFSGIIGSDTFEVVTIKNEPIDFD